jgi:hypothetical protein
MLKYSKFKNETTNCLNLTNTAFSPLYVFEFTHHPKYGCRDLKGIIDLPTEARKMDIMK